LSAQFARERTFAPNASSKNMMEKKQLAALARRAANGEPAALARLLDDLAPLVVRTARLIVGQGLADAEDAAQEALVDVARSITTLREPDAVVAWAATIATRRALRSTRKDRIRKARHFDLVVSQASAEQSDTRRIALSEAFDRLPPRQRAIAVLRLYLGLSEMETARALDISVGAVKSQLHVARVALTCSLEEAGFAPRVRADPRRKESDERQTEQA